MTLPMSATGAESTKIGQRAATDAAKKAAGNISVPAVDAQRYDPSVFTSDKGSEAYIREQDMQARVRDEIQSRIQNGEALSQEDMASILQQRRDELTQAEQQAGVSSFMPEEELDDYRMRYGSQDKSTFTKQSAEVSNDASPSTSPADHITDTSMPKSEKSPEVPLSPRNKDADQALTQQYGKSEPPHLENGEEEPGLQQQINDMRQEISRQKAAWENGEADIEEPDQEQAVHDVPTSASAAAPAMSNVPDGTKTLRADTEEPTAIPKMPSMPESKKPVDVLKDHLTGKSSKQHIVPEKPKIPQPHTGDPSAMPGVPSVPDMMKEAKDLAQAAKGGAPGVAAHVGKKLLDQAKSKIKNPNGSTSPLYSSKSPLGQKALSANPQKKKSSAADAVKEKAAEALVNKGLDVASKAGPAPVKIGAKIAKEALKNEAVKGALKDALDKTPLKGALGKDDKDSEENGMGRGSLRSKKTTQSSALIRMHKAMMVAKFALPLILLLLVMVLMGSCVAGIFGMITGSDDGGSSMIEQSQGSFIPTVKVGATKGICDEDEEDKPGAEREDCIELSSSKNKKQPSDNTSWVYLKQADFKYSVKGLNVPSSGCWMTSFCMVWSTYSGEAHEPKDLSTQMQGAFVGGGLGSRQGMADALNKANIGLDCKVSQPPNFSEIDAALAGGGCAMFFMNNKPHMAVIIGKNDDGTYKIADPAPESGKDSYNMSGGVVHKYKGKDYGIEFAIICNKK